MTLTRNFSKIFKDYFMTNDKTILGEVVAHIVKVNVIVAKIDDFCNHVGQVKVQQVIKLAGIIGNRLDPCTCSFGPGRAGKFYVPPRVLARILYMPV